MTRDIRFEIDYILSLTVATLGFLSIRGIKEYFDVRLGYLFLGILAVHLLLFNSHYLFKNIISIDLKRFSNFEKPSRYSLYTITVLFSYLFSHLLASGLYNYLGFNSPIVISIAESVGNNPVLETIVLNIHSSLAKTLIIYALPILGVLVFMAPLLAVIPSMKFHNGVEVVVSPENIEITDNFDETKDLSISILNNSSEEFSFDIQIDIPEGVILCYNNEEYQEKFKESATLSKKNPAKKLNFGLKYTGNRRLKANIPIKIEHKFTSKDYTVKADLYPGNSQI